jgi:hypothetical protein
MSALAFAQFPLSPNETLTTAFTTVTLDPFPDEPLDVVLSPLLFDSMTKDQIKALTPDQAQKLLVSVNACKCCADHSIRKPKIYKPWYMPPNAKPYHVKSCECCCRQIARDICRNCPK